MPCCRVGFKGGAEPLAVNNVLNLGVCPKTLIALMRSHFEVLGGVVFEQTAFKSAVVCSDGVVVSLLNAASSPAGVGDTNRPNALQRQQQQKVVGQRVPLFEAAVAGGVGVGGGERSAPAASSSNGHIRSSSSNGEGLSRGAAHNSSSSRYDRWLSAAAHSNGSNRSTPHLNSHTNGVNGTTSSSSSSSSQAQQDNRADASAAASNGHNTGRRAAPSKLTCRLVLDCMGECGGDVTRRACWVGLAVVLHSFWQCVKVVHLCCVFVIKPAQTIPASFLLCNQTAVPPTTNHHSTALHVSNTQPPSYTPQATTAPL